MVVEEQPALSRPAPGGSMLAGRAPATATRWHRPAGRTGGIRQGTIEFVAMVPLVLAVLVAAAAGDDLGYTAHAASQAARDGARAYSLDQSAAAAAQASLPGAISLVNVATYGPDHGVRVTVEAPPMLFLTRPADHPVGDHAMRREFSKGFVRLQDRNRTESEADDAQVRRFKQILLDEVDLQELSRLPARRAAGPAGAGAGPPDLPGGRDPLQPRALDAGPPGGGRGGRAGRPGAVAGRRLDLRDHDQRPRHRLRRAVRPGGADPVRLHLRGAAAADHRPDRLRGQPPGGRVEPDGRRPAARRRADAPRRPGQRRPAAAVADRPGRDDPALPQGVRAGRAAAARHPRPGERGAAGHLRPGPAQRHRLRRHGVGQDHPAERAVAVRAGPGAHRHGRGRRRAVA